MRRSQSVRKQSQRGRLAVGIDQFSRELVLLIQMDERILYGRFQRIQTGVFSGHGLSRG